MNSLWWFLIALPLAILLDVRLIRSWRRYNHLKQAAAGQSTRSELLKQALFSERTRRIFASLHARTWAQAAFRYRLAYLLELSLLALWAIVVTRPYLDLNPALIPAGREFGSAIQTHHLWTQFQDCGWCALWNGSERGGYPAFVDVHGSMLHPVVMVTTLLWGVVNGAKVALTISFWFAGLAQWWLAKQLGVGRLARLWSAGLVIVAGHLAGRMELGAFGVVLSTAMCSLVLAALLWVVRGGGRKAAIVLGVVGASAILSGQGYIQVGLLAMLPAAAFLWLDQPDGLRRTWKDLALALVLAGLLSAPFWLPFLHFSPNFVKETDPEFRSIQPLQYLPLNLVIDSWEYYNSDALDKLPYPHLYTLYIGWIPVLLAGLGLARGQHTDRRFLWFLSGSIVLAFLTGSAVLLKWVAHLWPGVAGIRHPAQIAGLAIPPILGLSAVGLEYLLRLDWPELGLMPRPGEKTPRWRLSLRWLILIPLFFSLKSGYQSTKAWIYTVPQGPQIYELLQTLETETLQWVEPPFGEHFYIQPAVSLGMKLSPGVMSWRWKDRELPVAVLEANRAGPPPGPVVQVDVVDGIPIYARTDQPYASVVSGSGQIQPCAAQGSGGYLVVDCNVPWDGQLVVKENRWSGWQAWRDGGRVALLDGDWLSLNAPAGEHRYELRYRPWDVPLGLALAALGALLAFWLWPRRTDPQPVAAANSADQLDLQPQTPSPDG
ncbi:MAG: hypothetical protein JW862_19895 [Anaerolineales bacterium]|nr:hypothetical protein [Anaerolineales bacterium]